MKQLILARAYNKKGILIGQGTNSYLKTHPIQKYFANKVGDTNKEFLHAEIAAILKAGTKKIETLVIERYDKKDMPRLARPCPICMAAIKANDIKYIRYTTNEGFTGEIL